jgi:hypothetical protein
MFAEKAQWRFFRKDVEHTKVADGVHGALYKLQDDNRPKSMHTMLMKRDICQIYFFDIEGRRQQRVSQILFMCPQACSVTATSNRASSGWWKK